MVERVCNLIFYTTIWLLHFRVLLKWMFITRWSICDYVTLLIVYVFVPFIKKKKSCKHLLEHQQYKQISHCNMLAIKSLIYSMDAVQLFFSLYIYMYLNNNRRYYNGLNNNGNAKENFLHILKEQNKFMFF